MVTAKWSLVAGSRGLLGGGGKEICVTEDVEGTFCADLNDFQ